MSIIRLLRQPEIILAVPLWAGKIAGCPPFQQKFCRFFLSGQKDRQKQRDRKSNLRKRIGV